jgi:hypothetical protein
MASGRGGARSGAGRKPGSRNKLTKALKVSLTDLAQTYTETALQTLAEIMKDKRANAAARVTAANSILDRGHGKPVQANVEIPHDKLPAPFDGWYIERVKPDPPETD